MFYEETVLQGVLHWRSTPDGLWIAYNDRQLTERLVDAQRGLVELEAVTKELAKYKAIECGVLYFIAGIRVALPQLQTRSPGEDLAVGAINDLLDGLEKTMKGIAEKFGTSQS